MSAHNYPVLEPRQLNDADEKILDELHRGRGSPSFLAERTDVEQTYINQRLRRLDEHGHVENLSRGLWELVDDPRDDVDAGDEDDLRGRLQDALEARDDAQARAERLADEVADLEDQADTGALDEADVERIRSGVDAARTALDGRDPRIDAAQSELEAVQEVLEDV